MLDSEHIAPIDVVIADYHKYDAPVAKLHGEPLHGVSLVDNHSNRPIKPMPKRHTDEHDGKAIYVTDTRLVVPRLAAAAFQGLSNQIDPETVTTIDAIHKATLVHMLQLPYVTVL
jgi:hypothetical protein